MVIFLSLSMYDKIKGNLIFPDSLSSGNKKYASKAPTVGN